MYADQPPLYIKVKCYFLSSHGLIVMAYLLVLRDVALGDVSNYVPRTPLELCTTDVILLVGDISLGPVFGMVSVLFSFVLHDGSADSVLFVFVSFATLEVSFEGVVAVLLTFICCHGTSASHWFCCRINCSGCGYYCLILYSSKSNRGC